MYFYAPQSGTATLRGDVSADGGATVRLDDAALGAAGGDLDLPIAFEAGYHALDIVNDPACPVADDPALVCPALSVEEMRLDDYQPIGGGS